MSRTFFTDRDLGNQFPDILAAAGIAVERHAKHFAPATPDPDWIASVAMKGWTAITHNSRIRYVSNERAAVFEHGLGLIVVVGATTHAEHARNFVRTYSRIDRFLSKNPPPFIAKVYRPRPREVTQNADAPGSIERWV